MDIRINRQKLRIFHTDNALRGVLSGRRPDSRQTIRRLVFNLEVFYVKYITFKSFSHTIFADIIFFSEEKVFINPS